MWIAKAVICICALAYFKSEAASIGESSPESSPFLLRGKKAAPGEFPYLAFVTSVNKTTGIGIWDSATLISDRHLLAKADHFDDIDWERWEVILGAECPFIEEPNQQSQFVTRDNIIMPESLTLGLDLAIIVLPQRVRFTDFVQPVLLPRWSDKGRTYDGQPGIVNGWFRFSGDYKEAAYQNVGISNYAECKPINPNIVCVAENLMDGGDNGAPLVLQTADGFEVVGIYSYGSIFIIEERLVKKDLFININEQLEFIANNTGINIRP